MTLSVVILAAGKGTRMRSQLPKVLHTIANKPMVQHVIDTSKKLDAQNIHLVYGHGGDQLQARLDEPQLNWVHQAEQLGTGHAMQMAAPGFGDDEQILMLYGDTPLIGEATLTKLVAAQPEGGIGLLTVVLDDPTGYGRILRDEHGVTGIIEHKDASPEQHQIREVNTGVLVASGADLKRWLKQLSNDNAQGEYYITDIIEMAHNEGRQINTVHPEKTVEVEGVNNRIQLSSLERAYQRAQAEALMTQGVTLLDPARLDVRGEVTVGSDIVIDVNVILEGQVTIEDGAHIESGCVLRDCHIGKNAHIKANSVIEGAKVGELASAGPFARLRPAAVLEKDAHVGNFVEMKKSVLGEGSKAGHLTYLGDSTIGAGVNIGAGTITCNYDGANKFQTIIEDGAFIGSDTQLVAPVRVGKNATIAAGTTLTKDAGEGELVLTRTKQRHLADWKRPVKQK